MLFSFRKEKSTVTAGAVLEICPGRIDIAIVLSDRSKSSPDILWSHTEDLISGTTTELEPAFKKALRSAFSLLIQKGLSTLREEDENLKIELVQVAVAAPFSYSIARNVSLKNDKSFFVTKKLLKELEIKAENEAKKIQSSKLASDLHLTPLSNSTVTLSVNDYPTRYPFKSSAVSVELCQLVSFAPTELVEYLKEMAEQFLPSATLDMDSSMALYFKALSVLVPKNTEAGLLMINDSATELCIIREGLPMTSTSIPLGLEKLAWDSGGSTELSSSETVSRTKDDTINSETKHRDRKKQTAEKNLEQFSDELKQLLMKGGNTLSLPKTIYLYVDRSTEKFFVKTVEEVFAAISKTKHSVITVSSEFFGFDKATDAIIACSAYVFHKKLYEDNYLEE